MGIGHLVGSDGGAWYNFWSGLGADIGGLTILGGAFGVYRKHNCHVRGCWRIAKQQVIGTSWMVCHHHHPQGHPTREDIERAHTEHLRIRAAQVEDAAQRPSTAAGGGAGADAPS